ncbi:30S ribosomal protein S16 [Candidatus Poribacteria bacterium]|nr:30S ribosomal protein S16 [Candidatus Poribacteria bacterium]
MSLKIRLKRIGAKKKPFYRIVIADSHAWRDGKFIDNVGHYNPLVNPAAIAVDEEKVLSWLSKGAQPTDTVKNLLSSYGTMAKFALQKAAKAKEKLKS